MSPGFAAALILHKVHESSDDFAIERRLGVFEKQVDRYLEGQWFSVGAGTYRTDKGVGCSHDPGR